MLHSVVCLLNYSSSKLCADPEGLVRGGTKLITVFFVLVDEGITAIDRPSSARERDAI